MLNIIIINNTLVYTYIYSMCQSAVYKRYINNIKKIEIHNNNFIIQYFV